MFRWAAAVIIAALGLAPARADDLLQIQSNAGGLTLKAWLARPERTGPSPAIVMLHGCSGLGGSNGPSRLYRDWRDFLIAKGYLVLMVDSAGSRGLGQTCTDRDEGRRMFRERVADAYAALDFLVRRPDVEPTKIALMGWSQGGGVVLRSIAKGAMPPAHAFAAAIAFYPGACSERLEAIPFTDIARGEWTTSVALLVLQGEADNWTAAKPCETLLEGAAARGAPVTLQLYPGAYHSFDLSDSPIHAVERYRHGTFVPIEGANEPARQDALQRVGKFLADHLAPR